MTTVPDAASFRAVMGQVPTAVTVVAGLDPSGSPVGLTIGSFVSVSLRPPLVGFLVETDSRTWPTIRRAGAFCVNVLSSDQGEICWRFAKESDDRFSGVAWSPAPSGAPLIDGVAAWIDCTVDSVSEHGDHLFVVGRVAHMAHPDLPVAPLIFHRGRLSRPSVDS